MLGEKEWNAHAEQVGRVTLVWNNCILQLQRIFCHLTGIGSPLAEAIFFSHQSDRGQRGMIKRIADAMEVGDADRKSLEKLLRRLERVSTGRNLAAHTIFGVSLCDPSTGAFGPVVTPALIGQDPRLDANFVQQFERVEKELWAICRDLEKWAIHTQFPERPWGTPAILGSVPGLPELPPPAELEDEEVTSAF